MLSLLPFLYLFSIWTKGAGASDPDLPFMVYLDQNHLVSLKWGYDNPQGKITFKFTVNATGWVSFGFSTNGGMKGSDIVMGGVGPSGIYFTDRYAIGNSMPLVDEQQSYELLSLRESEGQTVMTFRRTIQSCDDKDFHITAQPIKLIYAYGITDDIGYHGARRGTKEINLLNYIPRTTPTSHNYFSATVNNVMIPQKHTYYHCKVMKFPSLSTKHHIYQFEPVIEKSDNVHHMMLYRCHSFVTEPVEGPCHLIIRSVACFMVVAAWGVGGGVFEFPEDVGIPVGGTENELLYMLEIHYNNPNNEAGITDSSGLRLHYTATLRQHDVGILTTGIFPQSNYKIPPNASQFHTFGVCNTSLFSQMMHPVPDLYVFAVLMHTHLAGRKVRVGQYRNEEQIDFLALDENYNFDLQQSISLGNIKTIKPGDEIAVECTYSTLNRNNITEMGFATSDEMCLVFLYYYPEIQISECISQPNTRYPLLISDSMYAITSDQGDISAQENIQNSLPQIQWIRDEDNNIRFYGNGMVRKMMKTQNVTCLDKNNNNNNSRASRLSTSWILNPAGIILPFVWIAIM
ncbi:DBH-like monooxygenase protein 2 homolog [Centropristis striata]|uniref:DBH-like monooxygenase protein 2 homolog n=1 Tax=Centropristis striata TaxID=184440 RepID=UPI0027E112FB|nr:DBH-like monooxygenase protein 2 homolog [Centropristis striata]